jgi:hypothetical protein
MFRSAELDTCANATSAATRSGAGITTLVTLQCSQVRELKQALRARSERLVAGAQPSRLWRMGGGLQRAGQHRFHFRTRIASTGAMVGDAVEGIGA